MDTTYGLALFLGAGVLSNLIFLPVSISDIIKAPRLRTALKENYKTYHWLMKGVFLIIIFLLLAFPYSLLITHLDKGPLDKLTALTEERMLRILDIESARGIWVPYKYALIARVWSSSPPSKVEKEAVRILGELGRTEGSIRSCQHTRELDDDMKWWASCDTCSQEIVNSSGGQNEDN